jgi:hypothetical protein
LPVVLKIKVKPVFPGAEDIVFWCIKYPAITTYYVTINSIFWYNFARKDVIFFIDQQDSSPRTLQKDLLSAPPFITTILKLAVILY